MSKHEIDYIRKVTELNDKVFDIIEKSEFMNQSDLQSAIDAVIIEAIQYGKDGGK